MEELTVKMSSQATDEQLLYANILEKGMLIGLLLMFITFALYVFGIMPAAIPVTELSGLWNQPVHEYLEAINHNYLHRDHLTTGWSWITLIRNGDFLNFVPVAILSGVTIICYLAIAPGLFRRGDKAYGIMAVAEAVILALAASGLLSVGH